MPPSPTEWLSAWQGRHHAPDYRAPRTASTASEAIPRIIFQTAKNRTAALGEYGRWMRSWWRLNPEHAYHLFVDADADEFVATFCSASEQAAYRRSLVGAQRADLFRIYFLREVGARSLFLSVPTSSARSLSHLAQVGGVYADTDTELRRPLLGFGAGGNASALLSQAMDFDFMAFAPQHPLLHAVAAAITTGVHEKANALLAKARGKGGGGARACTGAHSCITSVTGPYAYRGAMRGAARQLAYIAASTPSARAARSNRSNRAQAAAATDVRIVRPAAQQLVLRRRSPLGLPQLSRPPAVRRSTLHLAVAQDGVLRPKHHVGRWGWAVGRSEGWLSELALRKFSVHSCHVAAALVWSDLSCGWRQLAATMTDIGPLLAQLGLQRHTAAFEEEEMTLDLLRSMSDSVLVESLMELGLGEDDVKRLQAALASGTAEPSAAPAADAE
eukprot:7391592-Prymnesium_polylepis.3